MFNFLYPRFFYIQKYKNGHNENYSNENSLLDFVFIVPLIQITMIVLLRDIKSKLT